MKSSKDKSPYIYIDPRRNQLVLNHKPIKGKWIISDKHEIQYRQKSKKDQIQIKTLLIDADSSSIRLEMTGKQSDQMIVSKILKVAGEWSANKKNQLVFSIKREKGKRDQLVFKNEWKINSDQNIIYEYVETQLKTKRKRRKKLTFRGVWDLDEKHQLKYSLIGDSNSSFTFKGAFQTQSILAKKGFIRYQIGFGIGKKRRANKDIILFGKWKYSNKFGFYFELKRKSSKKNIIIFGGNYQISDTSDVKVQLNRKKGKPLGVEIVFTKDFLNSEGKAFLRFLKSKEEMKGDFGISFDW